MLSPTSPNVPVYPGALCHPKGLQVFPAGSSPPGRPRGHCTAKRDVNDIWEESERPAESMLTVVQCHS